MFSDDEDSDDDDVVVGGKYENGHWIWDDGNDTLAYVKDLAAEVAAETVLELKKIPAGPITFDDEVDLYDQIRYRRRYQRKLVPGEADIITLQDVKDIAIFTAPFNILSPLLIEMLHIPTTERFIRAITLYCQYYLQVAHRMSHRVAALSNVLRTPKCNEIEAEYRQNLADLRVLIAKEYTIMLTGCSDTKKFHHKSGDKKKKSFTVRDARLFQTLLRMTVQIVWLTLGRRSFQEIELEVNRVMKSQTFNDVENHLHTGYIDKMSSYEQTVLFGENQRRVAKIHTKSPLIREVNSVRPVSYTMYSFGVTKLENLQARHRYLMQAVAAPEDTLVESGVTVGILGLPRKKFDTMLRPIILPPEGKSFQAPSTTKSGSSKSVRKRIEKLYPNVVLPDRGDEEYVPDVFPVEDEAPRPCSEVQRHRWQARLYNLLHPHFRRHPNRPRRGMALPMEQTYSRR